MPPKWVYTVEYRDQMCKRDAICALNAISGVSAENDNRTGTLLRNVTVTVSGGADRQIPVRILRIFGPVRKKLVVFKVAFKDSTHEKDAITEVEALKGAGKVEFGRAHSNTTVYGSNTPLPLKVPGDAEPEIVLKILRKYGTARFA